MSENPVMLQYLEEISDKATRIEEKLDVHSGRLNSLENTRERQYGILIAGGGFVTFLSWLLSWWGHH